MYVSGRYSVNVLPLPGTLLRRISPPSRCASSRLIASPRPVPPYLRAVPASACWNASKMILCFSGGMPMPVSLTENSTTDGAWFSTGWSRRPAARSPTPTCSRTPPRSVNLKAFDSRFFNTCSRRLESVVIARPSRGSKSAVNESLRASASWRKLRSIVSRRCVNSRSSHSTVTVPDSIFDRSRMSLIRFSRSVPAPWIVLANSTCRGGEIAVRVLRRAAGPRIRMLLSGVRSSCDMLARNSDL